MPQCITSGKIPEKFSNSTSVDKIRIVRTQPNVSNFINKSTHHIVSHRYMPKCKHDESKRNCCLVCVMFCCHTQQNERSKPKHKHMCTMESQISIVSQRSNESRTPTHVLRQTQRTQCRCCYSIIHFSVLESCRRIRQRNNKFKSINRFSSQ